MSKRYEDSAEFTADLDTMVASLNTAMLILQKPEFARWMKSTDDNYMQGEAYQEAHDGLRQEVVNAHKLAHHLEMDLIGLDDPSTLDENNQPKYKY